MRQWPACVFAIALMGLAGQTLACSCATTDRPLRDEVAKALLTSNAVFVAKVEEVERYILGFDQTERLKLRVVRHFKGPHAVGSSVETETNVECCRCGRSLNKGQEILFYGFGSPPYFVDECSTTLAKDAAEELEIFA